MTTMPTHTYALARHKLKLRDAVVVDLLAAVGPDGSTGTHRVEGTVTDATEAVLVLDGPLAGRGAVRIPWAAIAAIHDAHPAHPAHL